MVAVYIDSIASFGCFCRSLASVSSFSEGVCGFSFTCPLSVSKYSEYVCDLYD